LGVIVVIGRFPAEADDRRPTTVFLPRRNTIVMSQANNGAQGRIVEAAVQLFSRQGFSGTSTREIARLADVNETSLFRHFPRKQDLFWAALQSRLDRLRVRKELQQGLIQRGNPEVVVPLIVELLVHTTVYQPELIRLLYVGLLELRPAAERVYRQQLAPIFQAINDYLAHCVEIGLLRGVDPSITAVAFTTTVLAHQGMFSLFNNTGAPYSNAEEAVSAYTSYWLAALMPHNGDHSFPHNGNGNGNGAEPRSVAFGAAALSPIHLSQD
jgi:AcrR family transcriptional regulator